MGSIYRQLREKDMNSSMANDADRTIHAAHINDIHNVPIRILIRPIIPVLDEDKVNSLMETIKVKLIRDGAFYNNDYN